MASPNSNRKVTLPGSIRDFVERQATLPLETLFEDSDPPLYPYCEYWRRAVAGMLLCGRIAPKNDGLPNMTDVNRICKEANFDQYLFEATGRFLIAAKIIRPNEKRSRYEPAKFSEAFWNHPTPVFAGSGTARFSRSGPAVHPFSRVAAHPRRQFNA
jgi:hypothetical protein